MDIQKQIKSRIRGGSIAALLMVATALSFYVYWDYRAYNPATKDAYLHTDIVHVSTQVTGPIRAVFVNDNEYVSAGTPLFSIDNEPYMLAHQQARAKMEMIEQQINADKQLIAAKRAEVKALAAKSLEAEHLAARILPLVKKDRASRQEGDVATENYHFAKAQYEAAQESLKALITKVGASDMHNPEIRQAKAQLDKTNLDLQHTIITAPASGRIAQLNLRPGTIVNANQPLFAIVEQKAWWVEANFKETQLSHIHSGQPVKITLDMYPHHVFHGKVQSISPGSGDSFSLFPAENASGNWVKVTQRIPVKIALKDPDPHYPLRLGASAKVRVHTRLS